MRRGKKRAVRSITVQIFLSRSASLPLYLTQSTSFPLSPLNLPSLDYVFCISYLLLFLSLTSSVFIVPLICFFSYFLHKLSFLPLGPHSCSILLGFAPWCFSSSSAAVSELSWAHQPQEQKKKTHTHTHTKVQFSWVVDPRGFITYYITSTRTHLFSAPLRGERCAGKHRKSSHEYEPGAQRQEPLLGAHSLKAQPLIQTLKTNFSS